MVSLTSNDGLKCAIRQCQNFLRIFLTEVGWVSQEETRFLNDVLDAVIRLLS
jgi:hypothetical protein